MRAALARPWGEAELRLSGRGKQGLLRMCPKKCLHARPPLRVPACAGTPSPLPAFAGTGLWGWGLALCAAVMRSLPAKEGPAIKREVRASGGCLGTERR